MVGRELERATIGLHHATSGWTALDSGAPGGQVCTLKQEEVIAALRAVGGRGRAKQIAGQLGITETTARGHLTQMAGAGLLVRPARGLYTIDSARGDPL